EVCKDIDCKLIKSLQPIGRSSSKKLDYISYSEQIRNYFHDYINGNISALEALEKMKDITKIYYITIKSHDSYVGLINEIIILTISCTMGLSLIFLYIDRVNSYFSILPIESWFISVIGTIIIIFTSYSEVGEITVWKCHSKLILLSIGFTFNLIPLLYKLIINFPEENKISNWVKKNPIIFFLIFVIVDIIQFSLSFIKPYITEDKIISDNKNFCICKVDHLLTGIIVGSILFVKILIILTFLFLIFIEWNIQESRYDLRFLIAAIYIDMLFIILLIVIHYIDINDYIIYFVIRDFLYIFIAISNYSLIYGYKVILGILHNNENKKSSFIEKVNKNFINTFNSTTEKEMCSKVSTLSPSTEEKSNDTIFNKQNLQTKLINYHYRQYS
ncbi:hypothetical protein BCR36DRAFT_219190, partial [Piromyces finnis]